MCFSAILLSWIFRRSTSIIRDVYTSLYLASLVSLFGALKQTALKNTSPMNEHFMIYLPDEHTQNESGKDIVRRGWTPPARKFANYILRVIWFLRRRYSSNFDIIIVFRSATTTIVGRVYSEPPLPSKMPFLRFFESWEAFILSTRCGAREFMSEGAPSPSFFSLSFDESAKNTGRPKRFVREPT